MHYHGNGELSIVDSYIYANNNKKIMYCYVYKAVMVKRRGHNATLCVRYIVNILVMKHNKNTQYSALLFLGQPPLTRVAINYLS
jgi:hypothetical protein